ncbi:hypothetical protein O4328_32470 [Rhodococcus opacus]|uniref:Uncharacterized protein n=1 Tax=Rhodococcus opacus TaxID=37919 RepID=A0AAX3Y565_RHOOP|nr:hypothetical protein [Rhodococcus opacus]MCZ4588327.1 hypothetical protein [Rhodococcus opacus]WLF44450.1 hypothetical protein Q5707_21035 [Rhodococcus opacus]
MVQQRRAVRGGDVGEIVVRSLVAAVEQQMRRGRNYLAQQGGDQFHTCCLDFDVGFGGLVEVYEAGREVGDGGHVVLLGYLGGLDVTATL